MNGYTNFSCKVSEHLRLVLTNTAIQCSGGGSVQAHGVPNNDDQ